MKRLKWITFVLILPIVFFVIYRNSDKKGLKKVRLSFRMAIVLATSLASLSWQAPKPNEFSLSQNQIVQERVNFNQELNELTPHDQQVILVKSNQTPSSSPTRGLGSSRGFVNTPPTFGSRPKRPGTSINRSRIPPRLINQRFGAGGPGGGGKGDDPEWVDNNFIPEKKELKKFEAPDHSFYNKKQNNKKKNQSAGQCKLDENIQKIEIIDRIHENPGLERAATKTMKNQEAAKDIKHLKEQLSLGNMNPGINTKKVPGLKKVFETRAANGGRVYFQQNNGKIEILAISHKGNQDQVIKLLRTINY